MTGALCTAFVSILVHYNPNDPLKLLNYHKKWLWDERDYDANSAEYYFKAYHSIQHIVQRFNSTYTLASTYKIPVPLGNFNAFEEQKQQQYDAAKGAAMLESLKPTQLAHCDKTMSTINREEGHCFFIDGQGGSGKSYLYKTPHTIRERKANMCCV